MKKNKLELKKKLILNKEVVTKLTAGQQAKLMGGASGGNQTGCAHVSAAVCYKTN